jgi:putative component of toxin-antitoxin plasmid stabilization module
MIEIREYLNPDGRNLFGQWFRRLNSDAARRVTTSLYRLALGNFSNVKGVGAEFSNAESTSVLVIGCISEKMEIEL